MKHTKGPWVVYENISEFKTGYVVVETADGDRIYEREVYKSTYENEFANAALIAAAPDLLEERDKLKAVNAELLEALEEIVEQLEGEYFNFSNARAAIAKAEGL